MTEDEARKIIQGNEIFHNHWSSKCQAWLDLWEILFPLEPYSILNIGVGHGGEAMMWMKFIHSILPTLQNFEHLEINPDFVKRNQKKNNPYVSNVVQGDVRSATDNFSPSSFDIVFWSQGPEHIKREEWADTFSGLEEIAGGVVVLQVPWGSGYDVDPHHLSKSIRKGEFEDFGYTVFYDGKENTRDAGIRAIKLVGDERV